MSWFAINFWIRECDIYHSPSKNMSTLCHSNNSVRFMFSQNTFKVFFQILSNILSKCRVKYLQLFFIDQIFHHSIFLNLKPTTHSIISTSEAAKFQNVLNWQVKWYILDFSSIPKIQIIFLFSCLLLVLKISFLCSCKCCTKALLLPGYFQQPSFSSFQRWYNQNHIVYSY